jgi:hypothetical protein
LISVIRVRETQLYGRHRKKTPVQSYNRPTSRCVNLCVHLVLLDQPTTCSGLCIGSANSPLLVYCIQLPGWPVHFISVKSNIFPTIVYVFLFYQIILRPIINFYIAYKYRNNFFINMKKTLIVNKNTCRVTRYRVIRLHLIYVNHI